MAHSSSDDIKFFPVGWSPKFILLCRGVLHLGNLFSSNLNSFFEFVCRFYNAFEVNVSWDFTRRTAGDSMWGASAPASAPALALALAPALALVLVLVLVLVLAQVPALERVCCLVPLYSYW